MPSRSAIIHGFNHASRVVFAAAAAMMVAVFAGYVFSDDTMIKQFGFALATGVVIDALLVRMTLVPAVMSLPGEKASWIPRWLDGILPKVDVEGGEHCSFGSKQREPAGTEAAAPHS